jgi:hypothetical protein
MEADLPSLIDLIVAQDTRWHGLDPRLDVPGDRQEIALRLASPRHESQAAPLVVRNAGGRAHGYVQPAQFELPADSDLLAYFTTRNGTFERLVVPAPDHDQLY